MSIQDEMLNKLNEINKFNICDYCEEIVEFQNYDTIHDECYNSLSDFLVLGDEKEYDNSIVDPRVFNSLEQESVSEKFMHLFEFHQQCVKNLNSFFPEADTNICEYQMRGEADESKFVN